MIKRLSQYEEDEKAYQNERLKAAELSYPPRWITIGVTSACRNKCTFCSYHSHDAKGRSRVSNLPFSLPLPDFKRIVDMAWAAYVPRIHICGTGEPFFNKDIFPMIDYGASVYGKVSVQSNFDSSLFGNGSYLRQIVRRNEKISSLTTDFLSGEPQEHNRYKLGSSYEAVMSALKYIHDHSDIKLDLHYLLTHQNYHSIVALVQDLVHRGITNCYLNVVNLFSYDFNEFTSSDSVYKKGDKEISQVLEEAVSIGQGGGVPVFIPEPAGTQSWDCDVFWQKVQIWPVAGNDPTRYHENLIPHACRAVVLGELNSLGYIFDYESIMDFWNNDRLLGIRQGIINGHYPDAECVHCYCCKTGRGQG